MAAALVAAALQRRSHAPFPFRVPFRTLAVASPCLVVRTRQTAWTAHCRCLRPESLCPFPRPEVPCPFPCSHPPCLFLHPEVPCPFLHPVDPCLCLGLQTPCFCLCHAVQHQQAALAASAHCLLSTSCRREAQDHAHPFRVRPAHARPARVRLVPARLSTCQGQLGKVASVLRPECRCFPPYAGSFAHYA